MNIQCVAGSEEKVKVKTGENKSNDYLGVIRYVSIFLT